MNIFGYTALANMFDHPTGVHKHIEQMFHFLAKSPGINFSVLAAKDQPPTGGLPIGHPLHGLNVATFPYNRQFAERLWALVPAPGIEKHLDEPDWIYSPYEVPIPTTRSKLAVTVHSLFQFDPQLPGYGGKANLLNRLRWYPPFKRSVERAGLLLSISDFVTRQLIDWFDADPRKIVDVGNGVETEYFNVGQTGEGIAAAERPYVVTVSGMNVLDGAQYVIGAAKELLRRRSDLEIRVAGHQHDEPYLSQAQALPNIRLLGYIKKADLAVLMNQSLAMLFLNAYESFGIGVAEAMAAGTPVVATHSTAVPEVVADAGHYVNPAKSADVADFLIELAKNPSAREPWIEAGRKRAQKFTWAACGERLRDALISR